MSRTLAIVFVAMLAVNAIVGTVALTRTIHLGQASHTSSNALVAKRSAQLDRFEASLHAQLAKKPRPLPKVPSGSGSGSGGATVSAAGAAAPRVQYVRPAPIIVHKHRAGGEHEDEAASAGEGGGADD